MTFLLDNRFFPVTSEMGFVEGAALETAEAWRDWLESWGNERDGVRYKLSPASRESLGECLELLLPLTYPRSLRALFIGTASPWAAYFDNSRRGTDASSPCGHLSRALACKAIRIQASPFDLDRTQGVAALEVFDGQDAGAAPRRLISLAGNGYSWFFDQEGQPFAFEDRKRYEAPAYPDRFGPDLLRDYAIALGVVSAEGSFNDEVFYKPAEAYLFETIPPAWEKTEDYELPIR